MEENSILRLIYTIFLGILIALFVGVGINTFYSSPVPPKNPIELNTYGKELSADQIKAQKELDRKNEKYQEKLKPYNRNVSIMTLVAAVALLAGSMVFQKRVKVLADGIMLGGLFTLLYSVGRGFASENSKYVFTVVTLGLLVVIYLGYHRFVQKRSPIHHAS
jgi:hypothetical protein